MDYFKREPITGVATIKTSVQSRPTELAPDYLCRNGAAGEKSPTVEVKSRFMTQDPMGRSEPKPDPAIQREQRPCSIIFASLSTSGPIGIVATTSKGIVMGYENDVDKARAIYEWIVDNTFRDPKVEVCGIGDITTMLESGYLGGKCADLNALYVGLARAAGLPARDLYGIRVANSAEFKSLGRSR